MIRRFIAIAIAVVALTLTSACQLKWPDGGEPPSTVFAGIHPVSDIQKRVPQFARTEIDYDRSLLTDEEKQVVAKLIEASRAMDAIFWLQVSEKNPEWRATLEKSAGNSPEHAAALVYFDLMKGPWDRLVHDEPFLSTAGPKPDGAGFYPTDITAKEVEDWIAAHPEDKAAFQGLFSVIRRDGARLKAIPYSIYYGDQLRTASARLREAAAITSNPSLKDYLTKVADAFLTDDYYASDFAWMDLDSPIEVVIGPYEVYEDSLFNWKASFESFVTVVDKAESEKLKVLGDHLADMERNLPMPDEHKNPNRGSDSPIRVVQEIFTAGDARRGVQTAAFNLPNDEKVREAKGSKKVLLKNVMEAKFQKTGVPIANRVLDPSQRSLVNFDAFFNQVLYHELSHGLGPGIINGPDGQRVEARLLLKDTYSTIEETKADVLGLWNIEYAMDRDLVKTFSREQLYGTYAGLMFRSMRFGLGEAHGRGNAIQWNWFREKEGIVRTADGHYRVDFEKIRSAVKSLTEELLMIEATGDYARARKLVDAYGMATPEIDAVNGTLTDLPVDIAPVFVAAGEK